MKIQMAMMPRLRGSDLGSIMKVGTITVIVRTTTSKITDELWINPDGVFLRKVIDSNEHEIID